MKTLLVLVLAIFFAPISKSDDELLVQMRTGWSKIDSSLPDGKHVLVKRKNTGCEDIDPINKTLSLKRKGKEFAGITIDHLTNSHDVYGLNNDHAFDLSGKVGKPYVIENLIQVKESNERAIANYFRYLKRQDQHDATFFYKVVTWNQISLSEGFKIKGKSELDVNGQNVLEIEFECHPTETEHMPDPEGDSSKPIPKIRSGKALFLKDFNFLPVSWEAELKFVNDDDFFNISIENEFELESPQKRPSKRTRTTNYKGMVDVETLEFQYLDLSEISDSDFRLPAFGLPEPPFVQSRGLSYGWITILGLGVFAIGLLLVRNYRN